MAAILKSCTNNGDSGAQPLCYKVILKLVLLGYVAHMMDYFVILRVENALKCLLCI